MSRVLFGAMNRLRQLAADHPVKTNMATGLVLGTAGDMVAQLAIERRDSYDFRRTLAFGLFTSGFAGFVYTPFYRLLDRRFGTASSLRVVAKKVAAENLFFTPFIYFPSFYMITGAIRGDSARDSWSKMKEQYIDANMHAWQMWVVADAVNFALVPLQFRVIFACSAEFVWVSILSIISNRGDASDDKEGGKGGGGKREATREVDPRDPLVLSSDVNLVT